MPLNRSQFGRLYRPQGVKPIVTGVPWTSGGTLNIAGSEIDLGIPILGFRVVFQLRDVIGTANMTSANPLGYMNLIKRILITGRNARANGNATLWDIDLPSLVLFQQAFSSRKLFTYNGVSSAGAASAGTELVFDQPSTPITGFFNGTTGTYDIRIVVDIPAYPVGVAELFRVGYVIRSQEWADTLQIRMEFGTVQNGTTHALGTDAATTTHTFSSYGSSTGSPTIDVYSLPLLMSVDIDQTILPGYLSRVVVPVTTVLQSAGGANTRIATLQKRNTTRVAIIVGTSTVNPHFTSFSDTNLTTAGIFVAGNRTIRENVSIHAHKREVANAYGRQPIQGVIPFDFIQSMNPDSLFNAGDAGEGTTFEVRGTVAGAANALGHVIQETEEFSPEGSIYPPR